MSLSAILSEAFYFFRNHALQLAALTLPLLLLQVGIQLWLGSEFAAMDPESPQIGVPHIVATLLLFLVFSLLIASLTLFMELRTEGYQPGVFAVLQNSLPFLPWLMVAGVFSGMAIAAPVVMLSALGPLGVIGLGISLYLFARLSYVNFMVVVERLSPLQAIKASFVFSQNITGKTLLVLLLYFPLMLLGAMVSMTVEHAPMALRLLVESFTGFISLYVNVALFRLYRVSRQSPQ
ncbi:hypothetical protein [Shewanella sp. YIC-542]|uniref:hypothetical protein n=1 Tax=Shewanella mytili TaxID=3377111 RepID=UPI00398E340E